MSLFVPDRPWPGCPLVVAYGLGVNSTALLVELGGECVYPLEGMHDIEKVGGIGVVSCDDLVELCEGIADGGMLAHVFVYLT